jgi:hypothetical protein
MPVFSCRSYEPMEAYHPVLFIGEALFLPHVPINKILNLILKCTQLKIGECANHSALSMRRLKRLLVYSLRQHPAQLDTTEVVASLQGFFLVFCSVCPTVPSVCEPEFRHLRYAQVLGRASAGGDFFFKFPLCNGVYSVKNARRDLDIKI